MKQVRIILSWDRQLLVPAEIFPQFFAVFAQCQLMDVAYGAPAKVVDEPLTMTFEETKAPEPDEASPEA